MLSPGLMLRSVAQRRVSKHGATPSFETRPSGAPQDEAGRSRRESMACRFA